MTRLRLLAMRLRALFAKPEMDRALDEELQSHFDMLVEQNIGPVSYTHLDVYKRQVVASADWASLAVLA